MPFTFGTGHLGQLPSGVSQKNWTDFFELSGAFFVLNGGIVVKRRMFSFAVIEVKNVIEDHSLVETCGTGY